MQSLDSVLPQEIINLIYEFVYPNKFDLFAKVLHQLRMGQVWHQFYCKFLDEDMGNLNFYCDDQDNIDFDHFDFNFGFPFKNFFDHYRYGNMQLVDYQFSPFDSWENEYEEKVKNKVIFNRVVGPVRSSINFEFIKTEIYWIGIALKLGISIADIMNASDEND